MTDRVSLSSIDSGEDSTPAEPLDWKRAHAELVELARDQAALDTQIGRWLLYASRAVTHAWLGYASIGEYARRLFGFTPRQTQARLRVAEALEQLPALASALEVGQLCWSAVRELTRVATPETEAEWLAIAQGRTAHQVETLVAGRARGDHPHDPANGANLRRVLRFELAAEAYATVQEALTQTSRRAGGRLDDEQALLLMARQVLGGPGDDGRSSYQIAISVCPSCERGFQHARGELVEISAGAVDTASCDAQHIGSVDDIRTHTGGESGHGRSSATSSSVGTAPRRETRARGRTRATVCAQAAAGAGPKAAAHPHAKADARVGADEQAGAHADQRAAASEGAGANRGSGRERGSGGERGRGGAIWS